MNKLTLITALVLTFGLIATNALAGGNHQEPSASEFFYGVTIENTIERTAAQPAAAVTNQAIDLSASEFFYGYGIHSPVGVTGAQPAVEVEKRTTVPSESIDLLSPAYFFGYSTQDPAADKCIDC